MSDVGTFFRSVWADLVDKRLWPVALALVVAVVAVPVLLHKSAKPVDAAAPVPNAAATGPRLPVGTDVSLEQDHAQGLLGLAHLHDPFHQLHVLKAASSTTSSTLGPSSSSTISSSTTSSGGSGSSSSGGSSSGGGSSSNGGSTTHKATAAKVSVQFGPTGRSLKSYSLTPGTALIAASDPVLVLLGVQSNGKAAFLVSSDASPQGDGTCSPSRSVCTTMYMRSGDTAFIDVAATGGNVQYELDVKKVTKGS